MARVVAPVEEVAGLVFVLEPGAAAGTSAALVGGEGDRVEHDGHGVVMPAHHPESFAIGRHGGRFMPINRRVLARPGEVVVREALRERRVVGEVDLGGLDASVHARLRRGCAPLDWHKFAGGAVWAHPTSTLVNCQGSLSSTCSGNNTLRSTSGVQSVYSPKTLPR